MAVSTDTHQQTARRIAIFDTTLRDGEQAPANAMNPDQKLALARRLAALGVDCVEAGFPASSRADFEATRLISQHVTGTRFASFARTKREDVAIAVEAGGIENHEVQMVATGSQLHLEHKRGISREQAVREVTDTVGFAVSLGVQHIAVGIEDASRSDDDMLKRLTESALEAGATCIILADTTGCATPAEYGELIAKIREWAPRPIRVSTHCHDDFGLALANALAGLEAGADEVQATLGGIGERAGNTSMEQLAALLAYKSDVLGLRSDIRTESLYDAYNALREVINVEQPRNAPIFGAYAFGTAAGIHQQGILNNPATYEFVEPERFGRQRSMLVARHSGRTILRHLITELGADVSADQLEELYRINIVDRPGGDCDELETVRARLVEQLGLAGASADRVPVPAAV
jgi:2-isopropylmalate synthase